MGMGEGARRIRTKEEEKQTSILLPDATLAQAQWGETNENGQRKEDIENIISG